MQPRLRRVSGGHPSPSPRNSGSSQLHSTAQRSVCVARESERGEKKKNIFFAAPAASAGNQSTRHEPTQSARPLSFDTACCARERERGREKSKREETDTQTPDNPKRWNQTSVAAHCQPKSSGLGSLNCAALTPERVCASTATLRTRKPKSLVRCGSTPWHRYSIILFSCSAVPGFDIVELRFVFSLSHRLIPVSDPSVSSSRLGFSIGSIVSVSFLLLALIDQHSAHDCGVPIPARWRRNQLAFHRRQHYQTMCNCSIHRERLAVAV